jgi:hypothetical protein
MLLLVSCCGCESCDLCVLNHHPRKGMLILTEDHSVCAFVGFDNTSKDKTCICLIKTVVLRQTDFTHSFLCRVSKVCLFYRCPGHRSCHGVSRSS